MNWLIIWTLSIWQKIIPLILITIRKIQFFLVIGVLRVWVGGIGRVKQRKLKKLLGLSSVFSLGWLITSLIINLKIWLVYIIGYGVSIMILTLILLKMSFLKTEKGDRLLNSYFLILFIAALLILRGIPPLTGFFLKVFILTSLLVKNLFIALILLILRVCLILVYLIIIFYLLTFIVRKFSPRRFLNLNFCFLDLLISNVLFTALFLNFIFCYYYISNKTLLLPLKSWLK